MGNLQRRVSEHKEKAMPQLTGAYNVKRLVHFEVFRDVRVVRHD